MSEETANCLRPVYQVIEVIDHCKTGLLVRERRKKARLSLEEVAAATRSSTSHLSALERGDRAWNEAIFNRVVAAIDSLGESNNVVEAAKGGLQ